jgi:hypothetical protein
MACANNRSLVSAVCVNQCHESQPADGFCFQRLVASGSVPVFSIPHQNSNRLHKFSNKSLSLSRPATRIP